MLSFIILPFDSDIRSISDVVVNRLINCFDLGLV